MSEKVILEEGGSISVHTRIKDMCKTARNRLGLSNQDICDLICERFDIEDFSINTVNNFFSERSKATTIYTTGCICAVLDISIDAVFGIESSLSSAEEAEFCRQLADIKSELRFKEQQVAHMEEKLANMKEQLRQEGQYFESSIREKDVHFEQVIKEKDARFEQLIKEKDERFKQLIKEKDERFDQLIKEKDERFEQTIKMKDSRMEAAHKTLEHYKMEAEQGNSKVQPWVFKSVLALLICSLVFIVGYLAIFDIGNSAYGIFRGVKMLK